MVKVDDGKTQQRGAVLTEFYRQEKRLPSFSEMARLFGVSSKGSVAKIVDRLEAAGYLQRDGQGHLRPRSVTTLPLLGIVEAGFLTASEEELADLISMDDWLIQNKNSSFLLKVSGDSMIEAGLMPGDLVIIDRQLRPRNGDIVIATLDGKSTMKYYFREGQKIALKPANPKYRPILVENPEQQLTIHGVVRSAARVYR